MRRDGKRTSVRPMAGRRHGEVAQSVLRACRLLKSFRYDGELLRLRDVVERTSLSKTTAHRLLLSLVEGGLLERVGKEQFRSKVLSLAERRFRVGFATQTRGSTFSRLVQESVQRAAAEHGIDLVLADNQYSPRIALRNTDRLVKEKIDLVIEFQTYESVANVISSRFLEAGIPVIAVEVPHPGATYFGANNYHAGRIGGKALARWARKHWLGQVDEVLLIAEKVAGPLPRLRLTGMLSGIQELLPQNPASLVTELDGRGAMESSFDAVRRHVRRSGPKRTLVAAHNDPSALGALRAFEECGRSEFCAVMSQNAIPEARHEMRHPGSRLVGSVAYFPESYGDELIPLAIAILSGKPNPPAVYTRHELITPKNVDHIYPLDGQLPSPLAGPVLPERT